MAVLLKKCHLERSLRPAAEAAAAARTEEAIGSPAAEEGEAGRV